MMLDRIIKSFDNLPKPEFCNIIELSPSEFQSQWESIEKSLKDDKAQGLRGFGVRDLGISPTPSLLCPGVI